MKLLAISLMVVPLSAEILKISVADYEEKVYASWLGQCVGNIYGLPHENQYVDEPGPDKFPYGYTTNLARLKSTGGVFSDDDTDLEYMYLLTMEEYGPEPTFEHLTKSWKRHIKDRVWLANRAALGLMHAGYTPPVTGSRTYNPHWFQIDPQLINEIWAVTAPGMVRYATEKSKWAARVTSEDFGAEPTIHYGAMFSAGFFESDIRKLIEIGSAALPRNSRFRATVEHMKALHRKHPGDWKAARKEMSEKYWVNENVDSKTIWNANLNGAAGILALLYGGGDFQKTLDLACAMGFDADNQAATMAGLIALTQGVKAIPQALLYPFPDLNWKLPLNDFYKNVTRADMKDAGLRDMARRMVRQGELLILKNGGKRVSESGKDYYLINTDATFGPPLELPSTPLPIIEPGKRVRFPLVVSAGEEPLTWKVISGSLPQGLRLNRGELVGTPSQAGVYPATIEVAQKGRQATRTFNFVVRPKNLASAATRILASVEKTNTAKRDKMWLTVPRSLFAESVDVIRDGVTVGHGSTFYSITDNDKPRQDHFGYEWNQPKPIGFLSYHSGAVEENGGWFTSLNVEYRDAQGAWTPVRGLFINPPLPPGELPFNKPHFVERLMFFEPVTTNGIRIIGSAGNAAHPHSKTTHFTSISELGAYGPLPNYERLK